MPRTWSRPPSPGALTAAAHRYRAAYARELRRLPALLRTAKATPFRHAPAKQAG